MIPLEQDDSHSAEIEWELATHLRRRFGRYELVGKLGSGGMANVYLARATGPAGFSKLVAVKCIHPHLADDPQFVDMFLDEARIAACIDHPNVCSAFDFGEVDGVYFLAMDYLAGEPWSEVMPALHAGTHGRPAAERHAFAARIVADAAEGLHAAHEAVGSDGEPLEAVHRDVAPPNLFLRYDGQVQIVDFGCAKAAKRIFRTEYGKVRGHIAYVAPELLRGKEADRRADVWSLGVVVWELLTGIRLFRRTSLHDTMFAVARDEVMLPSNIAPSVPEELDAIVMRALQREPEDRYATARELAEDLSAFIRDGGALLGIRQLAGWMDALFPGGRARAARVLETAGRVHVEAGGAGAEPASGPRPRPRPEYPTLREKHVPEPPAVDPPTRILSLPARRFALRFRLPRKLRGRTLLTAAALLLAAGTGSMLDEIGFAGASAADETAASMGLVVPAKARASLAGADPAPLPEELLMSSERGEPVADDDVAGTPFGSPGGDARAAERPGRVNVLTPGGWANVSFGDRRLGPTPGQFTLPAGRHAIRVEPGTGEEPRTVWVTVRPGRVSRLVLPLD